MRDPHTLAVALQARDRHACTPAVTCRLCLPPGTHWPCQPWRLADATIDRLSEELPLHPDWLDPSDERSDPGLDQ